MKRIANFVKNTFKDAPKETKDQIITTVTESLIEKVEDLVESGLTLDQAIDKTVSEFGSAEDFFKVEEKPVRFKRIKSLAHYRNDLLFSSLGVLIIVGILAYINYWLSPDILWYIVPSIALLWWPLVVLYKLLNKAESDKGEDDE